MTSSTETKAVVTQDGRVMIEQPDGSYTLAKSQTDWERLEAMDDEDIDYSDIPELDEAFFKRARVVMPSEKKQISLRLDADVLDWMKAQGKGYQSRINAILRAYYEAHRNGPRPS